METIIMGLYRVWGVGFRNRNNGKRKRQLLYRILGSYKDNGKESGNYYLRFRFGFGYEGLGY